jgi:diguanylate cyclase (GGDEF)-like protein/PAS domain S-box-containing protein
MSSATTPVPQRPAVRERRLRLGGADGYLRGNLWSLLTVLAVLGALVSTAAVVRSRADQKDNLRRAQTALAVAPGTLDGLLGSPLALLAGTDVGLTEFPLNTALREQLTRAMRQLNGFWDSPTARTLRIEAARVNGSEAVLMRLLDEHRRNQANVAYQTYVEPPVDTLKARIVTANAQLANQIGATDAAAWRATLGIVGVAGTLLMALLIGFARARRRRLSDDVEQAALRHGERRLQALVEHGSDMITVVEPDTTVIYQAGAVGAMLGYAAGELQGAKLKDWLDPADIPALRELCETEHTASRELRMRHRDGSQRACEVHATNLLGDPAWEGVVLNIWDLSERKALEARLRHQAFHDTLTGLPNRALVLDRGEQMLARARRDSSMVAALFIDLDGFKQVNDSYGHAAGDQLLKVASKRLRSVVRDQDTVGRLGGDEFVVLLEPGPHNAPADLLIERLLEVLHQPIELEESGKVISVTASIGLAASYDESVEELLRDADFAMYEAKRAGRGRYILFETSMQVAAQDRFALESQMQDALDREELFLLYQPTFDLNSQRTTGVEALIRWRHPTRGVLSPDVFIPIAEDTGLIAPIGRWVLQEACRQAALWHSHGRNIGMSVNVSAYQLDRDGLERDVQGALADSGVEPSMLTLEITETALMHDIDAATERLKALKALGVRIAIDDFGTGHSSLAYLRKFPVDALKIDRSFIAGIASSDASAAIIRTLVQLGKTLGIETLAEGIEQPAQLAKLQEEQCDKGQGFMFARPLEVDAVEAFLDATGAGPTRALADARRVVQLNP